MVAVAAAAAAATLINLTVVDERADRFVDRLWRSPRNSATVAVAAVAAACGCRRSQKRGGRRRVSEQA